MKILLLNTVNKNSYTKYILPIINKILLDNSVSKNVSGAGVEGWVLGQV